MTPETKLLKKGGEKAVSLVVRALLENLVSSDMILLREQYSKAIFTKIAVVLTLMCAKVFISR